MPRRPGPSYWSVRPRIVGEPFHLSRSARRRRRRPARLRAQRNRCASWECGTSTSMPRRLRTSSPTLTLRGRSDHGHRVYRRASSTRSTASTESAAIAASCSGSRCRSPISRPCSRRPASRWCSCRCSPLRSPVAMQCFMLLLSTLVVPASGLSVAMLWSQAAVCSRCPPDLLYHLLTVHMLWYAPIYAWLLLVSAWARRAPFLWAVLPLLGDRHLREDCLPHHALRSPRWHTALSAARSFDSHAGHDSMISMHLDPGNFLSDSGSVDRPRIRRNISCGSGPAAALSRTDLIRSDGLGSISRVKEKRL